MSTVAFDTLKFSRRLQQAGMELAYAEALAEAQRDALNEALDSQVATKADIYEVKDEIQEVRQDTAKLKAELKDDIHEVRQDMVKLKAELKAETQEVKAELKGDIHEVKSEQRLMKWMLGVNLGFTVVMFWKLFNS